MHPNSSIIISVHVRDLQRSMHPQRPKRWRRPRVARTRQTAPRR